MQRQVAVTGVPPGQLAQAVRQRPVAALRIRAAPGRRAVEPQQAADPPLAGRAGLPEPARRLPEAARRLPLGGGRHHFFDVSMTSSSTCLSRLRSATMRFRRRFSPLEPLEPLQVGRRHASVLGLPAVDRPLGDAVLAGQVDPPPKTGPLAKRVKRHFRQLASRARRAPSSPGNCVAAHGCSGGASRPRCA